MKLSDFIGEATEYDKKEMLEERKPKSWLKSVSAFANGIGGALFFGVSNDEVLVGLDDAKGVSEKISEAIKTKMDPAPQVILEIHAEDGALRKILCKRYSTNLKNGAVFCALAGLNSLGFLSPGLALQYARPQGVNAARA